MFFFQESCRVQIFSFASGSLLASRGNPGYRRISGTEGKSALPRLFTQSEPRTFGNKKSAEVVLNMRLMPTAMTSTHTRVIEERAHRHTSSYQTIVHGANDCGDQAGND
jgi:hypothetical protein